MAEKHGIATQELLDVLHNLDDNTLMIFSTDAANTINILVDKYKTQPNKEVVPMLISIQYDGKALYDGIKNISSNFIKTVFYPDNIDYISRVINNNTVHYINHDAINDKKRSAHHMHEGVRRHFPTGSSDSTLLIKKLPQIKPNVKIENKKRQISQNAHGDLLTPMQSDFFELADGTKVLDNQGRLLILTVEPKHIIENNKIRQNAELTTNLNVNPNENQRYYLWIVKPFIVNEADIPLKEVRQNIAKTTYLTKGYDGVFYNKQNGETLYIPFFQDQIKYITSGRPIFLTGKQKYAQYSKKTVSNSDTIIETIHKSLETVEHDIVTDNTILKEILEKHESQLNHISELNNTNRNNLIPTLAHDILGSFISEKNV